jgi:hypothetical protein
VEIERTNAESRSFVVSHLVFAVGFGGGTPNVPQIPGVVGADVLRTVYFRITPSVI